MKKMDRYQLWLRICMIGVPIFTILAALSGFGWNYFGLKIKEIEAKNKSKESGKDSNSIIQNLISCIFFLFYLLDLISHNNHFAQQQQIDNHLYVFS